MSNPTGFHVLYRTLSEAAIEYILVGGGAAIFHGSSRLTYDVDIVYSRNLENLKRLAGCLAPLNPYLRGAPPGLPFKLDLATLRNGLNFTLTTDAGDLDLLGEIIGGGTYEQLLPHCAEVDAMGIRLKCVGLEKLIEIKRAAGRPKDLEAIAELEAIKQETGGHG